MPSIVVVKHTLQRCIRIGSYLLSHQTDLLMKILGPIRLMGFLG